MATTPTARLARTAGASRLGRVHTVRIPDALWDIHVEQAYQENRRDGVSEIIRDVLEDHARVVLAAAGIELAPHEPITDDHAIRYGELLETLREQQQRRA